MKSLGTKIRSDGTSKELTQEDMAQKLDILLDLYSKIDSVEEKNRN